MTKIDWSESADDSKSILNYDNDITEINWEGCPASLKSIDLWRLLD